MPALGSHWCRCRREHRGKGERERELVYVCMRVSRVGGGRYGPRAATAASEASPFFLQAFLPPPRFSPLLSFRPSYAIPLSISLSSFLSEFFSFFFSFLPLIPAHSLSLSVFLCISLALSRSSLLPSSVYLSLSFSLSHALSIHPARSAISPLCSPPTQRVPVATDTPRCNLSTSVPRSSFSFHPFSLPPLQCHSHAAGNRADPA